MSMTEQQPVGGRYTGVVKTAQEYYNSSDADEFYASIWGGEDIHIGIYATPDEDIRTASERTVERMTRMLSNLSKDSRVIDVGAGYGGSGRYLARHYGCQVACLNLSERQNERNRRMNKEQNLDHLLEVVDGSFEDIPYPDNSFDIAWSQDSFLHSGNRQQVLREVQRVLKPGGQVVFTDPMQSDDCPPGVLQPVLDRIHLDSLGSPQFYHDTARELGFNDVQFTNLTENLATHYSRVREELRKRYEQQKQTLSISKEYVERMVQGLGHWVEAGQKGYLRWGIMLIQ
jgi:sarcosine/dimethylglycine N-methyltransferase